MDNNSSFTLFFITLERDLSMYRSHTTESEKTDLMKRAFQFFSQDNHDCKLLTSCSINTINEITFRPHPQNGLFLYRKLHEGATIPHNIPKHFDIFEESSFDIYENINRTLSNIEGHSFDTDDVERLSLVLNNHSYDGFLCWSNTSIILDHVLRTTDIVLNGQIITFGSPIIIPHRNGVQCTNVYHEDDWILGLVNAIYKINLSLLDRNTLHVFDIDGKHAELVVFSKDKFKKDKWDAHKCFDVFL